MAPTIISNNYWTCPNCKVERTITHLKQFIIITMYIMSLLTLNIWILIISRLVLTWLVLLVSCLEVNMIILSCKFSITNWWKQPKDNSSVGDALPLDFCTPCISHLCYFSLLHRYQIHIWWDKAILHICVRYVPNSSRKGDIEAFLPPTLKAFLHLLFSIQKIFFGNHLSDILETWPAHHNLVISVEYVMLCTHLLWDIKEFPQTV